MILIINSLIICSCSLNPSSRGPLSWPQFRGDNGSGLAPENASPPLVFNEKTLQWKIDLPLGHSSPAVWEDRIYVTAYLKDSAQLQTICVDRESGVIIWKRSIFPEKIEGFHPISNAAQTSPVTDGEHVYVYFGSYGILCYKKNGDLAWDYQIDVNPYRWGVASSPVLYKDKLILSRDISGERKLFAFNKITGDTIWTSNLPSLNSPWATNWSTPVIYKEQIILHRACDISAYSVEDGRRTWWFPILTAGTSTPVIKDEVIYTGTWHNYSENQQRANFPDYLEYGKLLDDFDSNMDGLIQREEIPDTLMVYIRPEISEIETSSGTVKQFFNLFDSNKNGSIEQSEWDEVVTWITGSFYKEAGLIALKPVAEGELAMDQILWRELENVPEVPSPIYVNNLVFMCKDGGILTCMDAKEGTLQYCERIGAGGPYMASPVAAAGNIYLFSSKGVITVVKAEDEFNIIKQSDLEDEIYATPAIIGNSMYIRAKEHLYAFR